MIFQSGTKRTDIGTIRTETNGTNQTVMLAQFEPKWVALTHRNQWHKSNRCNHTIIPFGKYAYYGTDTLEFYANVIEHPNDSTYGRQIAIDRNQNILFDIVMFDNGPEPFNENLTRVLRNGKMGYANKFGQIIIPCEYDYAKWFENGKAVVTYNAKEYFDLDDHKRVESDEWFVIDKKGKKIN